VFAIMAMFSEMLKLMVKRDRERWEMRVCRVARGWVCLR
jgi:hypothetical protein